MPDGGDILNLLLEGGSPMRRLGVAGLQLDLEKTGNLDRLLKEVRATKARLPWVSVIVLSELATHGASRDLAEPEDGPTEQAYRELARALGVWLIPGSLYERVDTSVFNTTPVIAPTGEIVARYNKMFPFTPYEQGIAAGTSFCTFDIPGVGRIGISNCYDIWFGETTRSLVWLGAELIINPSLTNTVDRDVEVAITRAAAATNQCFVFNVNGAGRQGWGRSIACGPGGEILHQAGHGNEVFALELDLDSVGRVRERGWNGLGQVLKSFRDTEVRFPPYARGTRSDALDSLGPLTMPKAD